jgi:polyhydroxyalkanoate synthase subunit PhaC
MLSPTPRRAKPYGETRLARGRGSGHFCWQDASNMRMDKPTTGPAKAGDIDIEAFSRNVARLIEEGGKALAAYMKPREEGKIKDETVEDITDAVKAIGRVAEYWMSDPRRALELQTTLGRAYLDLWAAAVKRMAGEQTDPVIAPDPRDKRFADP